MKLNVNVLVGVLTFALVLSIHVIISNYSRKQLPINRKSINDEINSDSIVYNNYNYSRYIWALWYHGWNITTLPTVVVEANKSWEYYNGDWDFVNLDIYNLHLYLDNFEEIIALKVKGYSIAAISDIIRINLLNKYGGIWRDATVFCNERLENWLLPYLYKNDFFTYSYPTPKKRVVSWFLVAPQNGSTNYIINEWYKATMKFWNNPPEPKKIQYFWVHFLFNDCYQNDGKFRTIWNNTLHIDAPYQPNKRPLTDYYLAGPTGYTVNVTDEMKYHINNKKAWMYKLSWKKKIPARDVVYSGIHYLFDSIKNNSYFDSEPDIINVDYDPQLLISNNILLNKWIKREVIIDEKEKIWFCAIPKSACSIFKIFFHRLLSNNNNASSAIWRKQSNTNHYAFLKGEKYQYMRLSSGLNHNANPNILNNQSWTKFVIIRDPLQRLISAFLDKCVSAPKQEHNKECKNFSGNDTVNTFENFAKRIIDTYSNDNIHRMDRHFIPQSYWCNLKNTISAYQYVLHFADFQKQTFVLLQKLNLTEYYYGLFDIDRHNTSTHATSARSYKTFEKYYNLNQCNFVLKVFEFYIIDYITFHIDIPKIVTDCNQTKQRHIL